MLSQPWSLGAFAWKHHKEGWLGQVRQWLLLLHCGVKHDLLRFTARPPPTLSRVGVRAPYGTESDLAPSSTAAWWLKNPRVSVRQRCQFDIVLLAAGDAVPFRAPFALRF